MLSKKTLGSSVPTINFLHDLASLVPNYHHSGCRNYFLSLLRRTEARVGGHRWRFNHLRCLVDRVEARNCCQYWLLVRNHFYSPAAWRDSMSLLHHDWLGWNNTCYLPMNRSCHLLGNFDVVNHWPFHIRLANHELWLLLYSSCSLLYILFVISNWYVRGCSGFGRCVNLSVWLVLVCFKRDGISKSQKCDSPKDESHR